MKIRSLIFIVVIVLGLFPVCILVALNFPKTMERLEHAAELEAQARSHVSFAQLNARIRCLKKNLIRSATLPSTFAAVHNVTESASLSTVMKRWFESEDQVKGIMLFDDEGEELLSLHRRGEYLVPVEFPESHKGHLFFKQSLVIAENRVLAKLVDQQTDPFHRTGKEEYELVMSTPVMEEEQGIIGIMLMRIDMSEFLTNFCNSYWVTGEGHYLRGRNLDIPVSEVLISESVKDCNAFTEFPGLQNRDTQKPVIFKGHDNKKVAWIPLVFNREQRAVMWIGTKVDESAMQQWKKSLTINMVMVICSMAILVFISANWIAAKFGYIQRDLLTGLNEIINKEKRVSFNWNGPREIRELSRDLSSLSKRYSELCDARNRAEISLRESEDKFRSLTGSARDGIILMDHEGYIAYWNESAAMIFGYSSEEALQRPVHSLIDPHREGDDVSLVPLEQVDSKSSFSQTVELIARNSQGNNVYVELSLSSTTIKGKWHAIWIVRDISERKKIEEERRRQQQQLLHADKMISLGLLVSGVAHEINNPNSIALLNTPILLRTWESSKPILDEFFEENGDFAIAGIEYSEMRRELPRIFLELEESSLRIKQIVMDLKDYARQETSGQKTVVDITEVVQSGIRLTLNTIHKSTNTFITHFSPVPLMVLANRQRLTQVIINLIQNSCEALENPDLSLTITSRYNEEIDGVEISICDQGSGIAPDDLKQVTDPFFTTKRSIGGTGLGLSVSAGIVKEHNGVMNFSSEIGKGTEVVIGLPTLHTTIHE